MSGLTLRDGYRLGKALAGVELVRTHLFCDQLTMNGSLLVTENHDKLWRSYVSSALQADPGWQIICDAITLMPAAVARRLLYGASLAWWRDHYLTHVALLHIAARHGQIGALLESRSFQNHTLTLTRKADQLTRLEWVLSDDPAAYAERIRAVTMAEAVRDRA